MKRSKRHKNHVIPIAFCIRLHFQQHLFKAPHIHPGGCLLLHLFPHLLLIFLQSLRCFTNSLFLIFRPSVCTIASYFPRKHFANRRALWQPSPPLPAVPFAFHPLGLQMYPAAPHPNHLLRRTKAYTGSIPPSQSTPLPETAALHKPFLWNPRLFIQLQGILHLPSIRHKPERDPFCPILTRRHHHKFIHRFQRRTQHLRRLPQLWIFLLQRLLKSFCIPFIKEEQAQLLSPFSISTHQNKFLSTIHHCIHRNTRQSSLHFSRAPTHITNNNIILHHSTTIPPFTTTSTCCCQYRLHTLTRLLRITTIAVSFSTSPPLIHSASIKAHRHEYFNRSHNFISSISIFTRRSPPSHIYVIITFNNTLSLYRHDQTHRKAQRFSNVRLHSTRGMPITTEHCVFYHLRTLLPAHSRASCTFLSILALVYPILYY